MLRDLLLLIMKCVAMLADLDYSALIGTLIGGTLLGIACWTLCSYYSHLWNLRYRVTLNHHVLCGVAAVLTLAFTLTFVSMKYTGMVAQAVIAGWQQQIQSDPTWKNKTFRNAYEEVRALGVEDFSGFPHPDQGGHIIPSSKEESHKTVANVYATKAVEHFKNSHPYLSKILRAESGIPSQVINKDVSGFFETHKGQMYPVEDAVNLAANHIKQDLDAQVSRVVPISRAVIVILFLLVQAVPFGLIGLGAYSDLKITT